MPPVARELVVFIASPGDCDAERERVRAVADTVTQTLGPQLGVRIRVTGWEHVPPDLGRPQDQINALVDECDVFVGILGHWWGSPTGTHQSGFLEEFERVVQRRGDGHHPHIALYFRTVPGPMATDPGPQLRAVLDFQQGLRDEHLALYRSFDGPDDLERELWPLFAQLLTLAGAIANQPVPEGTSESAATATPGPTTTTELEGVEIDDARRQIIAATDAFTQVLRGGEPDTPIDLDRFLLVALALNDDGGLIPAHVANRLYLRRAELALSVAEVNLWLRTIAADIGRSAAPTGRVIPGWALLGRTDDQTVELLAQEDDDVPVGVFRALQRRAERPDVLWKADDDRLDEVTARWDAALRRTRVSGAAVEYLAALAQPDDVPLLDAICGVQETEPVRELRGLLAGDPAAMALAVAKAYSSPQWKVSAVSAAIPTAPDEVVRAVASSARISSELRRVALRELEARNLVDADMLKSVIALPGMGDAIFASVADPASPITIETIKSAVAKLDTNVGQREELATRVLAAASTVHELLASLGSPVLNLSAWEALGWKGGPGLVERARSIFDTDAGDLVAPLVDREEWTGKPDLLPFVRSRARLSALRILTTSPPVAEEDRARVRAEVGRDDKYTRQEALVMLASVATADDVPELLSHLSDVYSADRGIVVDAIMAVGGAHGARKVIESGEAAEAVRAIEALGPDPGFPDDELRELLFSSQADVRIAALEQLVQRLSPDALRALLDGYPRQGKTYYYNVVTELDWLLHAGGDANVESMTSAS